VIKNLVVISLFLVYAFNSVALGETADLAYLFKLSLEDLLKVKVTGATLTPKELKTVPSAVTVFTYKEINAMGLDTLDELMNLVPGFQSSRNSRSSMNFPFSSRGRSINRAGAEILILEDGMRLSDPRSSGSALIYPKYPLLQVERIEFIRGPGSAIYGSNAMMGVINIITRSDVTQGHISYGSLDNVKTHILASGHLGSVRFDLLAYREADNGQEYRVADTFSNNSIVTSDPREFSGIKVKLKWHSSQLNLHYNQYKGEDFYEFDGISNGHNQRSGGLTAISWQQSFNWSGIDSHLWLGYSESLYSTAVQLTAPNALTSNSEPSSGAPLLIEVNFEGTSETRLVWHNNWPIQVNSSLQFGVAYRHIDVPQTLAKNNFDLGDLANEIAPIRYYGSMLATTPVQEESNRDVIGLYIQYQHQLLSNTHLTLGLRHDDFSNIGSQLSPRLGLVQELNDHHSLKILYGEAYRVPAESDLNLLNNPAVLGNPELDPEIVQSSEFIWVGQWRNTGLSAGYFESRFKGAIVQVINGDTRKFENAKQGPSKGIELEISHQLNEAWLFRCSYTSIFEVPQYSINEADHLASILMNYSSLDWNANLYAIYHGSQDNAANDSSGNRFSLDDYWVLVGKLQFSFGTDWKAHVQVKNILNTSYLSPSVSTNLEEGVPNRGREIMAGVVWSF